MAQKTFIRFLWEKLPPFARTWEGWVATVLLILAMWLFMGNVLGPPMILGIPILRVNQTLAFIMAAVAFGGGFLLRLRFEYRQAEENISVQAARVDAAERQTHAPSEFPDYLKDQLNLTAERGRLLMVQAESRANMLYAVGTILTVLSVFAPLASIAVYATTDPLPADTISHLQSLRNAQGALPSGVSVSISRDWHILLSGISFGFLFLAAAGAIFAQHRRQMETYFTLGRDVNYFDTVIGAVDIANRADQSTLNQNVQYVAGVIVKELLRRPGLSEKSPDPETSNYLQNLIELLKQTSK